MRPFIVIGISFLLVAWIGVNIFAGWSVLPPMLLNAPLPLRTEEQREQIRTSLGAPWENMTVIGGQRQPLEVWWLHRPHPKGVAIFLHGFGDDAWGTLPKAAELPEWDAIGFTFRGRDRHPEVPCTLGGWERGDVAAVVRHLEASGIPRSRMILAAWSQGAGVALLALSDLEKEGGPLGGALLECPFENIHEAAKNHLKLALGPWEFLMRPAEWIALKRAGHLASFEPSQISPQLASRRLRTPIALITGDADPETPVQGVRAIADHRFDLTVVAGAGHCQASGRFPGGWAAWASERLSRWGF